MPSQKNYSKNKGSSDEKKWINQLRNGNQHGFKKIYYHYFSQLSQFLYRYVKSTDIAEDLVHNVFLSLWKNRKNIEARESLRPYLYQAVRNQASKHINRSKKDIADDYPLHSIKTSAKDMADEIDDERQFRQKVIEAVEQLPQKRRQVYLLSREDGLTYKEISKVLDISIKTVETQMSRSLRFLRKYLSEYLPGISILLSSFL